MKKISIKFIIFSCLIIKAFSTDNDNLGENSFPKRKLDHVDSKEEKRLKFEDLNNKNNNFWLDNETFLELESKIRQFTNLNQTQSGYLESKIREFEIFYFKGDQSQDLSYSNYFSLRDFLIKELTLKPANKKPLSILGQLIWLNKTYSLEEFKASIDHLASIYNNSEYNLKKNWCYVTINVTKIKLIQALDYILSFRNSNTGKSIVEKTKKKSIKENDIVLPSFLRNDVQNHDINNFVNHDKPNNIPIDLDHFEEVSVNEEELLKRHLPRPKIMEPVGPLVAPPHHFYPGNQPKMVTAQTKVMEPVQALQPAQFQYQLQTLQPVQLQAAQQLKQYEQQLAQMGSKLKLQLKSTQSAELEAEKCKLEAVQYQAAQQREQYEAAQHKLEAAQYEAAQQREQYSLIQAAQHHAQIQYVQQNVQIQPGLVQYQYQAAQPAQLQFDNIQPGNQPKMDNNFDGENVLQFSGISNNTANSVKTTFVSPIPNFENLQQIRTYFDIKPNTIVPIEKLKQARNYAKRFSGELVPQNFRIQVLFSKRPEIIDIQNKRITMNEWKYTDKYMEFYINITDIAEQLKEENFLTEREFINVIKNIADLQFVLLNQKLILSLTKNMILQDQFKCYFFQDNSAVIHIENGYLTSTNLYQGVVSKDGVPDFDGVQIQDRLKMYHDTFYQTYHLASELGESNRLSFFKAFNSAQCLDARLHPLQELLSELNQTRKINEQLDKGNLNLNKEKVLESRFFEDYRKGTEQNEIIKNMKEFFKNTTIDNKHITDQEIINYVNEKYDQLGL